MEKGTIDQWQLVNLGNSVYAVAGTLGGEPVRTSPLVGVDFAAGEARTLSGSLYKLGTPAK